MCYGRAIFLSHRSTGLPKTVLSLQLVGIITVIYILPFQGHDCSPVLFTVSNGQLKQVCKLDIPSTQRSSTVNSALQMFKNIDRLVFHGLYNYIFRMAASDRPDVQLKTLHQNMICQVLPHSGNASNVLKFTTCGTDGLIAVWDLKVFPFIIIFLFTKWDVRSGNNRILPGR